MKFVIGFLFLSLVPARGFSCPESLKTYGTRYTGKTSLCKVHDRYQRALSKMKRHGLERPERAGNLMAPRFINLGDWNVKRDATPESAHKIYDPAPKTWVNWEKGAKIIDTTARENFEKQNLPALTLEWLKEIHATALDGLIASAGRFRTTAELGLSLVRTSALTAKQSAAARAVEYPALTKPGKNLVGFVPTDCLEDRDEEFKKTHPTTGFYFSYGDWPAAGLDRFFTTASGIQKQCGYLEYAPIEEVEPQLEKWLEFINTSTATWGSARPATDPIFVAARAQRWFIAIHPLERGNGRMSRFVMDWLLQSVGLPAPILKDMNEDMYSTEEQWTKEVGDGVLRAVQAAEYCAQYGRAKGCAEISLSMSGESK